MTLDEEVVSPHQFRFIILLTIILFPFTFAPGTLANAPVTPFGCGGGKFGQGY